MRYRIGVDIGGTFTDFALFDDVTGEVTTHKQLTTPADPSVAVVEGVVTLCAEAGIALLMIEVDRWPNDRHQGDRRAQGRVHGDASQSRIQ